VGGVSIRLSGDTTAVRWWTAAASGLLLAAACGGDPPASGGGRSGAVVVASFDFAESRVLAEIYAQAIEGAGIPVERQLDLGSRELVLPALRQGLVDVVPEYAGSALEAVAPGQMAGGSDLPEVVAALDDALAPSGLTVLEAAPASNQNVVAVTAELAADRGLRTIGDLAPLAPSLALGGPPECARRPLCLVGLGEVYGLEFERFVGLGGADLVDRALADGVVDVGVLFSTDAVLATPGLAVLEDDRRLQPPDNVVPMVRRDVLADGRVAEALDEVSAALTTTNLRFLNWRVATDGAAPAAEAHGWLVRRGIVARGPVPAGPR
jgi:osmoprotectant transport system substrate-binding protein